MDGILFTLSDRYLFPQLVRKGGRVVEVGVFRGDFSQFLLNALEPDELVLVDQWSLDWKEISPFPEIPPYLQKLVSDYKHYVGDEDLNIGLARAYQHVCERFAGSEKVRILRESSAQAAKNFEDNSIDYLYIDANQQYEFVLRDLLDWLPKVRPGGLITLNDYYESPVHNHAYGVIPAVSTAIKRMPVKPLALCWTQFSDCVMYREPMTEYTQQFLSALLAQNVPMICLPIDIIGNYHHIAVLKNGVTTKQLPSFVLGVN